MWDTTLSPWDGNSKNETTDGSGSRYDWKYWNFLLFRLIRLKISIPNRYERVNKRTILQQATKNVNELWYCIKSESSLFLKYTFRYTCLKKEQNNRIFSKKYCSWQYAFSLLKRSCFLTWRGHLFSVRPFIYSHQQLFPFLFLIPATIFLRLFSFHKKTRHANCCYCS